MGRHVTSPASNGNSRRSIRVLAAAVVGVTAFTPLSYAAVDTWTGAASANWNDTNWTGGNNPPAPLDSLIFDGAANPITNNNFTPGTQFNGISFAAAATPFTLNGNSVNLGGDLVNNGTTGQNLGTLPLLLLQSTQFSATAGALTFGGGTSVTGGVAGALTLTLNGIASSNASAGPITDGSSTLGVTVAGSSANTIWALTGNNGFSGPVTVTGGVLRADNGVGLPTASLLTLNGGIWESNNGGFFARGLGSAPGNVRLTGDVGGFSSRGTGLVVTLGAANSTVVWGASNPNFNPGTLVLAGANANAALTFANGLDLTGGSRVVNMAQQVVTIAGAITDSVGGATFNKTGSSTGTLVLASGQTTFTPNLNLAAGFMVLAMPNPQNLTVSGNLTGAATAQIQLLPANSPNTTLTLTGNNSGYAGRWTIQAGTIVLNSNTTLGDGTGTVEFRTVGAVNPATTLLLQGGDRTIANPITYVGAQANPLVINGNDNLTFTGSVTGNATHQVFDNFLPKGKTITFNGDFNIAGTATGRTAHFDGNGDYVINGQIVNGSGSNSAATSIIARDTPSAINGNVTGTMIINSTVLAYTGGTQIRGGTLVFNKAGVLPTANAAAFVMVTIASSNTAMGSVGYAGGIQDPTFLGLLSGTNTLSSAATGALCIVSAADAATNINFNSAATNWAGMSMGAALGAYTYTGVLTPLGQNWRLGGGSGTLTFTQQLDDKNAAATNLIVLGGSLGTLVLAETGANYTGSTLISSFQTVKNGVDNALSPNTTTTTLIANSVYDLNGFNQTIRSLAGVGMLTSTAGTPSFTVTANGSSTFGGTITGSLGFAQQGTGTMTLLNASALSYTGATNVHLGTLAIGSGTSSGSTSLHTIGGTGGKFQVASGIALTSDGITVNTLQIDAGATQKIRLNGTPAGTSRINALAIAGSSISTGGWTGKLDITDNALIVASADNTTKLTTMATLADQITSGRGTDNGWTHNGIISSRILTDTTASSTLALVDAADLGGATSFAGQMIDANSAIVTRAVMGDADLSGVVDLADFDQWFNHVGFSTYSYINGDLNSDGIVDLADFDLWFNHVGFTGPNLAGGGGTGAVPEPASLTLLALGASALVSRKRRKR